MKRSVVALCVLLSLTSAPSQCLFGSANFNKGFKKELFQAVKGCLIYAGCKELAVKYAERMNGQDLNLPEQKKVITTFTTSLFLASHGYKTIDGLLDYALSAYKGGSKHTEQYDDEKKGALTGKVAGVALGLGIGELVRLARTSKTN